jgi:hypothetical protein
MPEGARPTPYVVLADEVTTGRIHVPTDAFATFCLKIDQALLDLELKWAHLTLPRAAAPARRSRQKRPV